MSSGRTRRTTQLGIGLLALVVPASALLLGSLLTWALLLVTALAAVACGLLWWDFRDGISRSGRLVMLVGVGLTLWTLLQAVPLPASFVQVVASTNADVWSRALAPLHEPGPAWHPLSVAPAATHVEVVRGLLYLAVFLGALRVAALEHGRHVLERIVIGSVGVVALAAMLHPAFGAERVFGVYRPRFVSGRAGPLLNGNHLAAYLDVGVCVAIASTFSRRGPMPPVVAGAAALVFSAVSIWAGSRGGTGALAVGVLLVFGLGLAAKRIRGARLEGAIVMLLVIFAGVMVGLASSEFARQDLADRDLGKLALSANALELVPRAFTTGFGRGAFESVFPLVRRGTEYVTFTHPENLLAQWTTEWGVPVSLLAAGTLAWALRPKLVLLASRPPVGAWAAIAASLVHELVDFHMEVPAVTVLLSACAALVVGGRGYRGETSNASSRLPGLPRVVAGAVAVASLVAVVLVLPDVPHALVDERERVATQSVDGAVSDGAFHAELRGAMLRYPGEAFFPLMGAVRAQRSGVSVVPWVGRALEASPHFGRAHLVLARSLRARNRAQARLEYRLAYENDVTLRDAVASEAPSLVDDVDTARELLPGAESDHSDMLERLATVLGARLPATAFALDRDHLAMRPDAVGPTRRLAAAALLDVELGHAWCSERAECLGAATDSAEALAAREPTSCEAHLLLARLRIAAGDRRRAFDVLEGSVERAVPRAACLRSLVELANATGDKARANAALDKVVRGGCGGAAECGDLYAWAASTEDARGNAARASAFYRRAIEANPERDDLLERLAELASRSGLLSEAVDAYGRLAQRHPDNPTWAARQGSLSQELERRRLAPR